MGPGQYNYHGLTIIAQPYTTGVSRPIDTPHHALQAHSQRCALQESRLAMRVTDRSIKQFKKPQPAICGYTEMCNCLIFPEAVAITVTEVAVHLDLLV